jgi:hypothetical protein
MLDAGCWMLDARCSISSIQHLPSSIQLAPTGALKKIRPAAYLVYLLWALPSR